MSRLINPVPGQVYTLRVILTSLILNDSPHLMIKRNPVQDSHLTTQQMLSVPGFGDTSWRYVRTTSEWVPIFVYVDSRPVSDFVDIEPNSDGEGGLWITPKGFPRDQFDWKREDV